MLKLIRHIWFGCSREVGCFSKELLREVLLYLATIINFTIIIMNHNYNLDENCTLLFLLLFVAFNFV